MSEMPDGTKPLSENTPQENPLPVNPAFATPQAQQVPPPPPAPSPAPATPTAPAAQAVATPTSEILKTGTAINPEIKEVPLPPVKEGHLKKYLLLFLAILIPAGVLVYIFYWNFLPFGFSKTYNLVAGSLSDTSGELYFEASPNLSSRKGSTDAGGNKYTYREVYGPISAIFKPTASLKDAKLDISIEGDDVALIPPVINIASTSPDWNKFWDFTNKVPADFSGEPFAFDGCTNFSGQASLQINGTEDAYEDGPLSIYTEWKPEDNKSLNQEIIGHFNWELYQNSNNVTFQLGRVNDQDGQFYIIKAPITSDFFGRKHSLLAIYSPSDGSNNSGYIELFIDGAFAGRTAIGNDVIWKEYGQKPLSLGWSAHNNGTNPYFKGCVYSAGIANKVLVDNVNSFTMYSAPITTRLNVINLSATGTIRNIKIQANE